MDDGRCLLDVIDDPDALTSFLDKQDEFGLDSADLEEFSRYQQQSLLGQNQYATGPNPSATMVQETPSSVLMRLENISPPPIQNDTVLSLLGDRPFTPTSHKPQPSQPASRPIIDLGFGEQEGGEIKEIFPDFMMGGGQIQAGNNQAFSGGDDLFEKLGVKESIDGSVPSSVGKDDFSSIFSFEGNSEKPKEMPNISVSSSNVQDVIQQSLMLSGVGDLSDDVPSTDHQEVSPTVQVSKRSAPPQTRQAIEGTQMQHVNETSNLPHSIPSSILAHGGTVQVSSTSEHQKVTTKSIPQVAVVRPQTQPPPQHQPQPQVISAQPMIDQQGQVINPQFIQAPGKVIGSGQQAVMPVQQTYVLSAKPPLNINPKLGVTASAASKPQPPPQQGIRIMLAPQGGGNIQTIGGTPTGQTIQLNPGQAGATGQQTVVLHNVQGAVQSGTASSVPVLQPVITIGGTQGSFIFMTRPTTVLAPQQIQQLQTSASGLATIQMPGQAIGSVVQPGTITVNQHQGGKQGLPVMQLVQSGNSGPKTYQTITLPQGYVQGGQTIVIQNPQGASNVVPIAQSHARIVQPGTNQVSFVQSQQPGTYGKVQATPQLIQPKVTSTPQVQTKLGNVSSHSLAASTAHRSKDVAFVSASKADVPYQAQPTSQVLHTSSISLSSSTGGQHVSNPVQPYVQSGATAKDEVQVVKADPLLTPKSKPGQTFRHKLYGKISTVQPDAKQDVQTDLQSSQVQAAAVSLVNQTESLETILQKVQPQESGSAEEKIVAQLGQALSSIVTQSQQIFVQQNSPPANTIVTPSNANAKGLPNQTQTLPGNNGSVPALVQHPQLAPKNVQTSLSSAVGSALASVATTTSSTASGPPKKKTQLKKQNMFGSRPIAPNTASNFQGEFLKTLQGKISQVVVSGSSTSTTSTSSCAPPSVVSSTVDSSSNQIGSQDDLSSGPPKIGSNTNVTASLNNVISSSGIVSNAAVVPLTSGLMSALEVKAKQMQESGMKGLAQNQQPMVNALQLKAQQMLNPQGAAFSQQTVQANQPMISALQLKNAGHFQGQGVNVAGPAKTQPMISALEVKQQVQQGQGMNIPQQPGMQTRPMVSALQLQQLKRQMSAANLPIDNATLMNQLIQLQQRKNAGQGVVSQTPVNQMQAQTVLSNPNQISRPPSTGQPLPSPQGSSRPPSVGQPFPSPQSAQSHQPPNVPMPSPQGMPTHCPPSGGIPTPSPQAMQSHLQPSAGLPVPSPQSTFNQRPPSAGQPLASPQSVQSQQRPPSVSQPSPQVMLSHHPQSVGVPTPSPQAMQLQRPPSSGQPLPSPQGRQASRPPSVGHPVPSPQGQKVGSPQPVSIHTHQTQQHMMTSQGLQNPQSLLSTGDQSMQNNQSMYAEVSQNVQNVSGQELGQGRVLVQPVQHQQDTAQSSTKMMPQLLQAFDLLKKAQAAQAKGPSGAQEQAQYMQQFQLLLQKHPDLMKQLQHLKQKQQLAKQQQMARQQQMGASMPASSFQQAQQAQQANATGEQQFQQQQQRILSASADQAQLVASSILQATQNASAAHISRGGGDPSSISNSDLQPFLRPSSATFSVGSSQRPSDALLTSAQTLPDKMNPNYTPNVTIQPMKTGEKDGMQRLSPSPGGFLPNQNQPMVVSSSKKKPPPSTSMLPPMPPAPTQAPPNVSILPSQKQAPLGTIPSVTKEKDVFEFDDDDPVPVKVENKFTRKIPGRASSGTVHHQPLSAQQNPSSTQPHVQIDPTGATVAGPGLASYAGSQANQLTPQASQSNLLQSPLSKMLQNTPQVVPPVTGYQQSQAVPSGLQPGEVPQGNTQTSPATALNSSSNQTQSRIAATSLNAGSTLQTDANVASRRLQQLQQSQQSTTFKPKAKSKTSHFSLQTQKSLHNVQGFIRQLEGIVNRTPKQEAMLQQLLDLQQKINDQARAKLDPSAAGAAKSTAQAGGSVAGGGAPGFSSSADVTMVGTTGIGGQNSSSTGNLSMAELANGTTTATSQPFVPIPVSTNLSQSSVGTFSSEQTTGQYKVSKAIDQKAASSSAAAAAASAAAAAAAAAAQASTLPSSGVQGSTSITSTSIPIPVSGVQTTTTSSAAANFQQVFTTNIVQLVGKNLTAQQQDVLRRLQDQLKNMTPQQQQEFYRQQQAKLQNLKKGAQAPSATVQPPQQPSSSTPTPKVVSSPVKPTKPSRSKAKKKGAKGSPKGDRTDEKSSKDVEIITPQPLPRVPTPPPAAAEFIRERRDLDKYCVENVQFKTPFASFSEAIQRLLPYHIAYEKIPTPHQLKETESSFDEISNNLMKKKRKMMDKFQYLLYQESMIREPSSESVMLGRLFLQDETAALQEERKLSEANRGLVESLMPKTESSSDEGTTAASVTPSEARLEHSFAQPARVGPQKAEPRHKTNHDRIRGGVDADTQPSKRSAPQGPVLQRQRQVSGDSENSSGAEGQYQSSIVSRYPSSDEEAGSTNKGASSSGGGIRLRLTKSLLVESKVKSRDRSFTSESDDSVLSSPTKPKRRKSQLEALLSSDSVDSDYSPSGDYRTKASVWKVSEKSKDLFTFQDDDSHDSTHGINPSQQKDGRASTSIDAIMDDALNKDDLQEQMDSAVNSILFLQNPGPAIDPLRHASLADISFDQDDVFDSADDSAVFNLEDYANTSFLEESSAAVAGIENEFTGMHSDVEEAVKSIL